MFWQIAFLLVYSKFPFQQQCIRLCKLFHILGKWGHSLITIAKCIILYVFKIYFWLDSIYYGLNIKGTKGCTGESLCPAVYTIPLWRQRIFASCVTLPEIIYTFINSSSLNTLSVPYTYLYILNIASSFFFLWSYTFLLLNVKYLGPLVMGS